MLSSWTSSFFDSIQQNPQGFIFELPYNVAVITVYLYLESDKQVSVYFENFSLKSHKHPNLQIRFNSFFDFWIFVVQL